MGTFNLRIYKNYAYTFILVFLPGHNQSSLQPLIVYDYHARYRIKIKLICRITNIRDQALIRNGTRVSSERNVSRKNEKIFDRISRTFFSPIFREKCEIITKRFFPFHWKPYGTLKTFVMSNIK